MSQDETQEENRDVFKLNDFWFYIDSLPEEGTNLLENIKIVSELIEEKENNLQKLALELQIIKLANEHLVDNMLILSENFERVEEDEKYE